MHPAAPHPHAPGCFWYMLFTTFTAHSTREKLMRQKSPGAGGTDADVLYAKPARGSASSTLHRVGRDDGSFSTPSVHVRTCSGGCMSKPAAPYTRVLFS
jgi:hypothetical protein